MASNYAFRISAEGIDRFVADMQKAAAGNEQLTAAWQRFVAASPGLQTAMERAQAATDRAADRFDNLRNANDNAAGSARRFGQVMGQAGFQIQDFAVQVQSGTSALTALSQQGSQFLGVFGTGGAIAGAVLTVGLLVTQILTGKSATDAWAEAIKAQAEATKAATEAADRWREGLDAEAQKVLNLRTYYASLSEERRDYELRAVERQRADLQEQQAELRSGVIRGLGGRINPAQLEQAEAAAARLPAEQRAIYLANPDLERIRQGVRVLEEFRGQATITEDVLATFSARLREIAGDATDRFSSGLRSAADSLEKSGPKARELAEGIQQLDDRFRALNGQLSVTQERLARLREAAVEHPLAGLAAEVAGVQQRAAALQSGGLDALERVTQQQTQQAEITRRATAAQEQFAKALVATGVAADEAARRAEEAGPGFVRLAGEAVRGQAELDRAKREAEERRREREQASRQAASAAEAQARRARSDAEGLQNAWENFFDKGEERSAQRLAREQEARLEAEKRQEQQRQEAFDRTVERYSQQLSTGVTDALFEGFKRGEGFAETAARVFERGLRSAVAAALDTELIRPLLASLLGSAGASSAGGRAGGDAGGAGLGSLLGLGGIGEQLRGALGFGGASSAGGLAGRIDRFGVSSGLFGNGISPAAQGPTVSGAPLGSLSQSGLFGSGTLTQALGGIGLGFGAGATVGGIVGGIRGTVGPGSTIGAAGGALTGAAIGSIIPGVGTLLGGLLGGALGGAGGGLFGPTRKGLERRSGGDVFYGVNEAGQLVITGARGKRFDEAAARAEVQQQLDELNRGAAARGLTFGGISGALGFGQASGSARSLDQSALVGALRSGNANESRAFAYLAGQGRGISDAFSASDFIRQTFEPLARLAGPVDAFADSLQEIRDRFGEATRRAEELGLATDRLGQARDREIAKLTLQREAGALGTIATQQGTLTDFLNSLAAENLSPQAALTAAQEQFGSALDAARAAGLGRADLSRVVTAGRSLISAGRSFYATGPGGAELQDFVTRSISNLGAQLNLPAFGGSLDLAVESLTGLTDEVQLLRGEVARLREELRSARLLRAA